eukprot:GHUV01019195.1.p1 GENE.GHUV01019195.1~~GHUV01019195.1.p1  ORF type:complete len:104 (+),score=23.99 GHUV01019195.1:644-955(+)
MQIGLRVWDRSPTNMNSVHWCSTLPQLFTAFQVIFRAGAYADLSMNDGGTLVAAIDSAYDLSGLSVDVKYARCNIPPHTIVRAPGFLQGVMVLEQVIEILVKG